MNFRTLSQTFPAGAAAVAVSLALTASTATALQTTSHTAGPGGQSTPVHQGAAPAPGGTSQPSTTLTPAAPVSSKVPASSAEDIRDIRQPRHLPTPIPWVAGAVGVVLLAAAAFGVWRWLKRGRFAAMTPQEIALQKLDEARGLMNPDHAREYCFAVSEIIRNYLEVQFHFQAPRLTTEEFLRDLVEVRQQMLATHRSLLGDFLQHCDLAKFAGWVYSTPALEDMHRAAVEFVQQTALDSVAPESITAQPVPTTH